MADFTGSHARPAPSALDRPRLPVVVPTGLLLRRALGAIVKPHRAFAAIQPDDVPNYRTLIPTLMAGGLLFFLLHSRFVIGQWVWELAYAPMILAQYAMAGIWNWLIGGLVVVYVCRWWGRTTPMFGQVDIAVFYLWMTWVLMPLFDVVHLFGMPTQPLVLEWPWRHFMVGHFALWVTHPIRILLLYFLFRALGAMSRGRALGLALGLSFGARFALEPSGSFFFIVAERLGYHVNFWVGQYYLIAHSLLYTILWRLVLARHPWRQALARTGVATVLVLLVTLGAWHSSWASAVPGVKPAPQVLASQTVAIPPQHSRLPHAVQVAWVVPVDVEGGVLHQAGPLFDGDDHRQTLIFPIGSLTNLSPDSLQRITCEVRVDTDDGFVEDASPWIGCEIAGTPGASPGRDQETTQRDLKGPVTYQRQWTRAHDQWQATVASLASGDGVLRLMVGVRGGGDYTNPDTIRVLGVRLVLEQGSDDA